MDLNPKISSVVPEKHLFILSIDEATWEYYFGLGIVGEMALNAIVTVYGFNEQDVVYDQIGKGTIYRKESVITRINKI